MYIVLLIINLMICMHRRSFQNWSTVEIKLSCTRWLVALESPKNNYLRTG